MMWLKGACAFEEEGMRNYVETAKRNRDDNAACPGPRVLGSHRKTLSWLVRAFGEVELSDNSQIPLRQRKRPPPEEML